MALLKGKGAMTGVNLIAKVYKNGVTKNGTSQYADVQLDARDSRGPEQTNLHLKSDRVQDEDGKVRYEHDAPYSIGQIKEIVKAAGPNTEPILNRQGAEVGTLYGFKGNVMPASRGTGLVVNTKSVEASEFKVDNKTLDNQFASMRNASASRAATKKSQAQAASARETKQAQGAEAKAEIDEPALG
ncbi:MULTISPECIES: hypothetical protein [unclassified Streptomyces]|uniref:hypothetical protein n=1 Tax=unclassified Streptomyces TaxID=2593676 RepID=UPI00365A321F